MDTAALLNELEKIAFFARQGPAPAPGSAQHRGGQVGGLIGAGTVGGLMGAAGSLASRTRPGRLIGGLAGLSLGGLTGHYMGKGVGESFGQLVDQHRAAKTAAMDPELQQYYDKTEGTRHLGPSTLSGGSYGAGVGGGLGLLGGGIMGALGGKSIPGRIAKGVGGALLGGVAGVPLGLLAGAGVGGLVDRARGTKGAPYTPEEREQLARSRMLEAYNPPESKVMGAENWESVEGLSPADAARHKKMLKMEREYVDRYGRSPY